MFKQGNVDSVQGYHPPPFDSRMPALPRRINKRKRVSRSDKEGQDAGVAVQAVV